MLYIVYRAFSLNGTRTKRKLDVTFEEASEVFFDPFYQTGDASSNNEKREFIIGYSSYYRLLLVVFVERSQRNRLISARPTTRAERKLYENA